MTLLPSSSAFSSSSTASLAIAAPTQNLNRLLWIRWVLLLCLVFGVVIAKQFFAASLPIKTLVIILIVAVVVNVLTHWRLKQGWPLTDKEFAIQILLDIIGITSIFYFSGGASNPFVSYYLVPLIISATTLPWMYTGVFALLSLATYTVLLFYYIPIDALEPGGAEHIGHGGFHPHIIGMWFTFLMSATLITFFIVRMSNALREQERELNSRQAENLRDEQVLAVATLAAGTAHELGSPLTTMKVLLSEMAYDNADNRNLQKDLTTLKQQIESCSATLKQLTARAEITNIQQKSQISVEAYFKGVLQQWALVRPDVKAKIDYRGDVNIASAFHPTLDQAIINLLNNAADAGPNSIDVEVAWDAHTVSLSIADRGQGIPKQIREQLGQPFITTKGKGLGLGLFLSNVTINRSGGSIHIDDRPGGGTVITIKLPLVTQ